MNPRKGPWLCLPAIFSMTLILSTMVPESDGAGHEGWKRTFETHKLPGAGEVICAKSVYEPNPAIPPDMQCSFKPCVDPPKCTKLAGGGDYKECKKDSWCKLTPPPKGLGNVICDWKSYPNKFCYHTDRCTRDQENSFVPMDGDECCDMEKADREGGECCKNEDGTCQCTNYQTCKKKLTTTKKPTTKKPTTKKPTTKKPTTKKPTTKKPTTKKPTTKKPTTKKPTTKKPTTTKPTTKKPTTKKPTRK